MCLDYRNVRHFGRRRLSHYQQEVGEEGGGLSRVRVSLFREIRSSHVSQFLGEILAWDCQRHDALFVHPAIGGNTF